MASKTIEDFLQLLKDRGISSSERSVRRKLSLINCEPEDLADVFTKAFIAKMLQDGFEAALFNKLKRDSEALKTQSAQILKITEAVNCLEREVQNLKDRLEALENSQKVVYKPVTEVIEDEESLKPWERSFNSKGFLHLLNRYRSIPETDERHIVNWVYELTEKEREDFFDWAAMDWDDPNHPRYR